MAWLDMVNSYEDLGKLKNEMVACDNVSRTVTQQFSENEHTFSNEWIDEIADLVYNRISLKKGSARPLKDIY